VIISLPVAAQGSGDIGQLDGGKAKEVFAARLSQTSITKGALIARADTGHGTGLRRALSLHQTQQQACRKHLKNSKVD
jgi:hypothetical protein